MLENAEIRGEAAVPEGPVLRLRAEPIDRGPADSEGEQTWSIDQVGLRDPRRGHNQEVVQRAEWLEESDAALVRATYRDGHAAAAVARIMQQDERGLQRRLRKLIARLVSAEFSVVIQHWGNWNSTRRAVARACVLHGRSIRVAAEQLNLSLHTVRRHREAILAMAGREPVVQQRKAS